jgi:purine-binding chemotaxis protein CheW
MSDEQKPRAAAGKYLTFALAEEEYGLPVLKVREIIKSMDVTAVPQVPAHIKGVINLRGKVIPIVDLRIKFGLPSVEATERTCIIVAEIEVEQRRVMLGAVVDCVSEVLNISAEEIEPTPDFGQRLATDYLKGVAKIKGTVKLLLDLDQVLATDTSVLKAA